MPDMDDSARYLVWSNEHQMWWRPAQRGYTPAIEEAGRYRRSEAAGIVANATCDGLLTRTQTDPVTGHSYQQPSEVLLLAPEHTPVAAGGLRG